MKHHLRRNLAAALLCGAIAGSTAAQPNSDALYQSLGGAEGISHFVDDAVVLILADERIKDQFKDSNMKRLAQLLKEQFCQLSGGPCNYSGDDMKTVHEKLSINSAQFNALAEDLQVAMDKNNVPSSAQNKLLAKLAPMHRDIVPPR
jgi:hemoglobin